MPEGALSQLTESERAEIASLTATSVLVRTTLHSPEPRQEGEESSLKRAQDVLSAQPAGRTLSGGERRGFCGWLLARFRGRK